MRNHCARLRHHNADVMNAMRLLQAEQQLETR